MTPVAAEPGCLGGAIDRATVVDRIRRNADERPEHAALVVDDAAGGSRVICYRELVAAADAHARSFAAQGLRSGDRCGLLAPQGSGFVERARAVVTGPTSRSGSAQ